MADWIGVDFDGTLAYYEPGTFQPFVFGDPIMPMVERVKRWLAEGYEVRVFTARVAQPGRLVRGLIEKALKAWCLTHIGQELEITNEKDMDMLEFWDDRAVQVKMNTGEPVGYSTRGLD